MSTQIITTKSLSGLKAVTQAKGKKIGKVYRFVFHPSEKRVVGILVRRPDAALMFHRKDLFVALNGFHVEDGQIIVHDSPNATDRGALRALGVNWDDCVIWVGMPVLTRSEEFLGYVDVVSFDAQTGAVQNLKTENGATNDVILGKRVIPAHLVQGFKQGIGMALVPTEGYDGEDEEETTLRGAILVSDEVLDLPVEGGAAAAAGKATAVVADKAKRGAAKAKAAASEQAERAKPTVAKVAKRTGEAVDAGTFAVGRQLGRASGMFAAFKEEFDKASKGED
ncbi:MAG: PRC-barrel domain-containing protein [Eggerthellaceae bacterium]|nr:PRC-barrel domain-containing protein [Eggerthellaceae bacterium]